MDRLPANRKRPREVDIDDRSDDAFVLKQSKKKAKIRVKEGRAQIIDWLAVTLSVVDPTHDALEEDDGNESYTEIVNPAGMLDGLKPSQLQELSKDIENYLALETNAKNRKYWNVSELIFRPDQNADKPIQALKVICREHQSKLEPTKPHSRSFEGAEEKVATILKPKSLEQLEIFEQKTHAMLQSNQPIDVEFWEYCLRRSAVYKAKAKLDHVYKSVIEARMTDLRIEQQREANIAIENLSLLLVGSDADRSRSNIINSHSAPRVGYMQDLDPKPHLKLRSEDKALEIIKEQDFIDRIVRQPRISCSIKAKANITQVRGRRKVSRMGYVPLRQNQPERQPLPFVSKPHESVSSSVTRFAASSGEDFSTILYDREVARGIEENEEVFTGEEEVSTVSKPGWANKLKPRKPRYFNRVQMGYEWNKYNQTHYDHDNPPPKVVQGYKFNIFYPDLIDKAKAPTYHIEREGGRKRGQSFAPAGEEDTCLIRFSSGPPYEDLAFRIVDKEWDYSAKRERGFQSSFDKVEKSPSLPTTLDMSGTDIVPGHIAASLSIQEGNLSLVIFKLAFLSLMRYRSTTANKSLSQELPLACASESAR